MSFLLLPTLEKNRHLILLALFTARLYSSPLAAAKLGGQPDAFQKVIYKRSTTFFLFQELKIFLIWLLISISRGQDAQQQQQQVPLLAAGVSTVAATTAPLIPGATDAGLVTTAATSVPEVNSVSSESQNMTSGTIHSGQN